MTSLVPAARRSPARRAPIAFTAGLASSAALVLLAAAPAHAAAAITTLESQNATVAAESLAGEGVEIRSASLSAGRAVQAATFTGLGLDERTAAGLALSTGSLRAADPAAAGDVDFTASSLAGPNVKLTTTGDLGGAGSARLEQSFGATTYDAAELQLEVVPDGDTLTIVYQIGSEEYAGWAERDYVDAFGVYVGDELCSVIGDEPAGVASINPDSHSDLFVSNLSDDGTPGDFDTELNGFTTVLTCTAAVTPRQPVTVTAAVADTIDGQLDSTLLLAAGGISSVEGSAEPSTPPTGEEPAPSATPVPAGAQTPVDASRPGSRNPLAVTGADGAPLLIGAIVAAGAVAAGAALAVSRRRSAARGVSEQ